jgi:gliding motility-associated-like protein
MWMGRNISLLCIAMMYSANLLATHNRAGEITYIQLSNLTIRATLITYTKTSSVGADRDTLSINWGDGSFTNVKRSNGNGQPLPNDIKKNIYIAEHTYPGRGTYSISMLDPNRIDNILNVDPPNSINVPFYIQSTITLFNTTFQGINHSPILLKAPIDIACLYQVFEHNPSAYDEDGDSLSFELVTPLMAENTGVPNYLLPSQILPGINNAVSLDSKTGSFTWRSPQRAGEYNIAIAITEYRKGIKISSTIRDMQILVVESCKENNPPLISGILDTCVVAGSLIDLSFFVDDPDKGSRGGSVKVEVDGAPLFLENPALVSFPSGFNTPKVTVNLKWNTACNHVRKEPYSIFIKAVDNYFDTTGLTATRVLRIKVIGPKPSNLRSINESDKIRLFWDFPYVCNMDSSDFKGFSVWRKINNGFLLQDTCNPGLEQSEYMQIAYLVNDLNNSKYTYLDSSSLKGIPYCYRVQAEFAKLSPGNYPYNFTPSLASNETCDYISTDAPLLLNADVLVTNSTDGKIKIKWTKPDPAKYDYLNRKPPFTIKAFHSVDFVNYLEIAGYTQSTNDLLNFSDTLFIDSLRNTIDNRHFYKIVIGSNDNYIVESDTAQSIFLNVKNDNGFMFLSWDESTPWNNYEYTIFKKNKSASKYDSIFTTSLRSFQDKEIIYGEEYCYLLRSKGSYGISWIESPLINHSNEFCITAIDSTPPCCPDFQVKGPCENRPDVPTDVNEISWNNPNLSCISQDISGYRVYVIYPDGRTELLTEINDPGLTKYTHLITKNEPLCYQVSAFDTLGLECKPFEKICANYCPSYELPNTFTPNGDGFNDVFTPRINRYIQSIELSIVNRWGQVVYTTVDPEINWNGNNNNGNQLSDGTYYYKCKVRPYPNAEKIQEWVITGFIELLKGR